MNSIVVRNRVALLLSLTVLGFGCARNAPPPFAFSTPDPSKPQFRLSAADLAAPAVLGTNGSAAAGSATVVVRLQFASAKADAFRTFTREHANRQMQLIVGTNVVAEPHVVAEIKDGRAELAFSSIDQARAVQAMLGK